MVTANGCSRTKYRLAADREAYDVIGERNADPRWRAPGYRIEMDPRSRYFDPCDPDCSPMPPDDPTSNQYMHYVDGTKGWKHWGDFGQRIGLENPAWREAMPQYVDTEEDGAVKLNVESALKLAYVNSPQHQTQLETLYLSALDVTAERFRLDTQFFGGYDAHYTHNGSLVPAGLRYNPALGRFEVGPAFDGEGVENNRVTLGRPFGADPALQARRHFATAGDLLVGFANSFVFEFTGNDANLASSLANFSLVQPLLRGAGKDVALEQLTLVERGLLADLRAYQQYRQGFYTQIAIGDLGVIGPQRGGGGTNLLSFSGGGGVRGYVGLVQELQQIRNTEDNLSLSLRTLAQLEALLAVGIIDLVQVDQFRQNIESQRASLLASQNNYQLSLESYKTSTLGLPPDLPVELDDELIHQFQLVPREATAVQDSIIALRDRIGQLPDDVGVEPIRQVLTDIRLHIEPVRRQLDEVQADLARMDAAMPERARSMTIEQRNRLQLDREQLIETLADLQQQLGAAVAEFDEIDNGLAEPTRADTVKDLIVWLGKLMRLVQRSITVQARARLEAVTIDTIDLKSPQAYGIALANRLDFMNARASLVDRWRSIQVSADALQSVLNVTAGGDLRTARNNPLSFRAPTGSLRLGLEFDAPLTRLLERNNYRASLINYQQDRRGFIQSCDRLNLGLRALLRDLTQLRESLEIQRRAVAIAIRRVDMTRAELYAPVRPPQPGQRAAQFGPTAAINLLSAQSALRDTQNAFMGVWLNYYATKMRLARELGVMQLNNDGSWMEYVVPTSRPDGSLDGDDLVPEEMPAPPPVPARWIEMANFEQPLSNDSPRREAAAVFDRPAADHPNEAVRRLPPIAAPAPTNGYNLLQNNH